MREDAGFLKALEENEDDVETRLIYADYLDDRGEHEEAERQRQWPAAKAWLVKFASRCGDTCVNYGDRYGDDEEWREITYRDVVDAGTNYVESNGAYYFIQLGTKTARHLMSREEARQEYWRNWSIVTGRAVPGKDQWGYDPQPFRCSC